MRYEHLVQINDLEQPLIPVLERSQLWSGVLARAEHPALFDPTIDATRELRRDGYRVEREVHRGASSTRETVRLWPEESIEVEIGGATDYTGSSLTIAIEEPARRALFLRFKYELRGPAAAIAESEQGALRQAYHHANLELVRRIRALAAAVPGTDSGDESFADRALRPGHGGAR